MKKHFGIADAVDLCFVAHSGQYDLCNQKYHNHPLRVLGYLLQEWPDASYEEQIAALLHDVIEDTKLTLEILLLLGVPKKAVDIILLVTKPRHEDRTEGYTYDTFINSIIESNDKRAIRIKLSDIKDNTNKKRLQYLSIERQNKLLTKYQKAEKLLLERLELLG